MTILIVSACGGGGGTGSVDGGTTVFNAEVSTLAGMAGTSGLIDGTGSIANFDYPTGIAYDSFSGNLYIAEAGSHRIRKVTVAGVVTGFAGTAGVFGSADGLPENSSFNTPSGIAVDSSNGDVYVADTGRCTIRKISFGGLVSTLAGSAGSCGSTDGTGSAASFSQPIGLTVDLNSNVFVADAGTIRKITPGGVVSTFAGTAGLYDSIDGIGNAARFKSLSGITIDKSTGNLFVADSSDHTIRKITAAGVVTTIAGTPGVRGSTDGISGAAEFSYPGPISFDSSNGNLYLAEGNHTIRKITSTGIVSTLAGTAGLRGSTDAVGAAARFYDARGVTVDSSGNVYVADSYNHTIRKIVISP